MEQIAVATCILIMHPTPPVRDAGVPGDWRSRSVDAASTAQPVRGLAAQIGKRHPFELPEEELFLNLLRAAEMVREPVESLIKSFGLSNAQYNALRILRGHGGGPLSCGVIADQMVTREPDISRLLCRMETSGLITRQRDSTDRRVVLISLTEEGRERVDALDTPLRDLHRAQFGQMCAQDIDTLNALLSRVQQHCGPNVNG